MKVSITKESKNWMTLAQYEQAKYIISAEKEDEFSAKDWSEYAVRAWLSARYRDCGSRDYLRSVLSASAEIAGNCRVWNLWDDTGTLDVWIECVAETDNGFLKLGFYLSDAWSVGSAEANDTLFCNSYARYYTEAK